MNRKLSDRGCLLLGSTTSPSPQAPIPRPPHRPSRTNRASRIGDGLAPETRRPSSTEPGTITPAFPQAPSYISFEVTPMKSIAHLLAVFREDGSPTYQIDAVQLSAYPISLPFGVVPPLEPNIELVKELERKTPLGRGPTTFYASIESSGMTLRHNLGGFRGGVGGKIGALVNLNIIRRVRDRLAARGDYDAVRTRKLARRDNFIDPRPAYLKPGLDLHDLALEELLSAVVEVRTQYIANVEMLFGFRLTPEQVAVSITNIELTWDAICEVAGHALTAFWPPWKRTFRGAGIGSDDDAEDCAVKLTGATSHREPDAQIATHVLRFSSAKGYGGKLYVKHDRLLRFENEVSGKRVKRILGHRIRLDSRANLEADLNRLAVRPYASLLKAQAALTSPVIEDVFDLLGMFFAKGRPEKIVPLLKALRDSGKFHHRGRTHKNILPALKHEGLVEDLGGGEWGPTPHVARVLQLIEFRMRSTEPSPEPDASPAAPDARRRTRKMPTTGSPIRGGSDA